MSYSIITLGLNQYISQGVLPKDEWDKIKRDVMAEQHQNYMRGMPKADEDPQVAWDFHKDWRTSELPEGKVFGSDYDHWNYVVEDILELWKRYTAGMPQRDFIVENIANLGDGYKGWSKLVYAQGLGVWQNSKEVSFGARLEGPRVDVGPTADFAAFLENWDRGRHFSGGPVALFRSVGVLNTIANELKVKYLDAHTIFLAPIRTVSTKVVKTKNRTRPVYTFPVIRIAPRHYRHK